jgi:hypothetical protein
MSAINKPVCASDTPSVEDSNLACLVMVAMMRQMK